MRYTIRPLGPWTGPETSPRTGSQRFKATWSSTLQLLERELEHLDAENVVMQVDVTEGDIRLDGMLRANAKVSFPGVRVSFDSRHGPLTYATDAYERHYGWALPGWQANVRAIALGLEALRAVDRYGVTRRGEQYTGWKAIGGGPTPRPPAALTIDTAALFLAEHSAETADVSMSDLQRVSSMIIGGDPRWLAGAYRTAARRLHPDLGGDTALFQRLQEAKRLLDEHHAATSRARV